MTRRTIWYQFDGSTFRISGRSQKKIGPFSGLFTWYGQWPGDPWPESYPQVLYLVGICMVPATKCSKPEVHIHNAKKVIGQRNMFFAYLRARDHGNPVILKPQNTRFIKRHDFLKSLW